ncbi:MAG: helix-turn-helix domain-containing protein [Microbacteriaceae bacterium]|nr:helix-turn-helix domain-containing protein [Microbacteriaceae bacterium]
MHNAHSPENKESVETSFLTTAQAAALIGYTPRMLEVRRARGEGPRYVRFSKRAIRYRREDLETWIAERIVSERHSVGQSAES